nr:MAG TPA: hypothetical protein [Bacteriophage sp.]
MKLVLQTEKVILDILYQDMETLNMETDNVVNI